MGHAKLWGTQTRVCPGPEARESPESTGPSVNPLPTPAVALRRPQSSQGAGPGGRSSLGLTREHFGTGISGVQPITEGAELRSRWKRWVGS
jgi:hypothetical protein